MMTPNEYGWQWGPFRITRVAHDDRIGWVLHVEDNSAGYVEVRTTPKGLGMKVRQVLWRDGGG